SCTLTLTEDAHVGAQIDRRRYVVQDLGTLPAGYWSGSNAISPRGGFVAGDWGSPGTGFFYDGVMHDTGVQGDALGVHALGVVVGVRGMPSDFTAYRWMNGVATTLPSLGGNLTFA